MCQMVCHNIQGIRIDHMAEDIQELLDRITSLFNEHTTILGIMAIQHYSISWES